MAPSLLKKQPGGKRNVIIPIKYQKQLIFKSTNALIDPIVSLTNNCIDITEKDAQNACFSFVLSGCVKHIIHLCKYHRHNLVHLEIENKGIPKPLRNQLNKNNLGMVQQALASSCKQLQSSF